MEVIDIEAIQMNMHTSLPNVGNNIFDEKTVTKIFWNEKDLEKKYLVQLHYFGKKF